MSAKVLAIGLDAANATLIERWADRGLLPNIARLRAAGTSFRLNADCMETLPGAIWSDISYSMPAHRHGLYYHPEQFFPAEGVLRRVREDELVGERMFWHAAARQGLRCVVVDVPFMPLIPDFNGVQLRELAIHDLHFGVSGSPAGIVDELRSRHGPIPMQGEYCDIKAESEGRESVYRALLARADYKTAVLGDIMEREDWDLFFAVLGETHCGAHYVWPRRDRQGRLHSPDPASADPWRPLRAIYERMDAGIGELIRGAGPDAKVVLFTSHSVGTYLGGPQLLPEVLRRLHLSHGWDWPGRATLRKLAYRVRSHVLVRTMQSPSARTPALIRALGISRFPDASPGWHALAVPNNRIGGIRLNLAGREANGSVAAHEAPELIGVICHELEQLRDPRTGERVVKSAQASDTLFGPGHAPGLPDIIVKFRTDLGPLDSVRSPSVGRIFTANEKPFYRRSGDHTPQSRAWIAAEGYGAGVTSRGDILDIGPTILSLLGVAPPSHAEGVPLIERLQRGTP